MVNLLRRRGMMQKASSGPVVVWHNVSSNAFTSWARSSRVTVSDGSVVFKPNALDWNTLLTSNGLQYKWSQVKNGKVHLEFDCVISGINGTNARLAAALCLFTTESATTSTARKAYALLPNQPSADGTHHFSYNDVFPTLSGTVSDSYYLGLRLYAYTGASSQVTLSNVVFQVTT